MGVGHITIDTDRYTACSSGSSPRPCWCSTHQWHYDIPGKHLGQRSEIVPAERITRFLHIRPSSVHQRSGALSGERMRMLCVYQVQEVVSVLVMVQVVFRAIMFASVHFSVKTIRYLLKGRCDMYLLRVTASRSRMHPGGKVFADSIGSRVCHGVGHSQSDQDGPDCSWCSILAIVLTLVCTSTSCMPGWMSGVVLCPARCTDANPRK